MVSHPGCQKASSPGMTVSTRYIPSKHAGSDLVTVSYGHYGQHAARIGLDHICWIHLPVSDFVPFLQRRPRPYSAKLTWIQSGWPGQVWVKHIWHRNKPLCKNHWAWFLAFLGLKTCCLRVGIQPPTSFPLSDSVAIIHGRPGSYCAKPA